MFKKMNSGLTTLITLAVVLTVLFLLPRQQRWGATDTEVEQPMPGDEEVLQANYQSTRAITIKARATSIWPWLVQMGQGRGGLYSYAWLEKLMGLRISNVDQILSKFQHLKVGDIIPLEPGGSGYRVASIEPNVLLVLVIQTTDSGLMGSIMQQGNGASTWVYQLRELDSERTRLVIRWRMSWKPTFKSPALLLIRLLLAPIEFVMERKMLLGIKKRAECVSRQAHEPVSEHRLR